MAAHRSRNYKLCCVCFLLQIPQVFSWKVQEFPNPNKDVNACGRRSVKSWVCDPDGMLKKGEADKLEEWLAIVHHETDSDCVGSVEGKKGYEIGVAVAKGMDVLPGETAAESAEKFAKSLHDTWGIGKRQCNDGALIFLSVKDRQVYISTGQKTKEKLSNEQIDLIIEEIRPLLREKRYGKALEQSLELAKGVLEGKPLASSYSDFGAVVSLVFCVLFVLSMCHVIKNYYNQKKYKEFEKKLSRIDEERKNPKEYKVLVCPICLADFTPQTKVKLLVCGHKYCEPCLSEWLKTKTSCPICRQNVNRNPRDTGDEQLDSFTELRYRLSSLHNQYPHFISHNTISHWLSPGFRGTFLDDVSRNNRSVLPSGYDGSLGSSSSFGGGTSVGGGGSGGSW